MMATKGTWDYFIIPIVIWLHKKFQCNVTENLFDDLYSSYYSQFCETYNSCSTIGIDNAYDEFNVINTFVNKFATDNGLLPRDTELVLNNDETVQYMQQIEQYIRIKQLSRLQK